MNKKLSALTLSVVFILLTACSPLFGNSSSNLVSDELNVDNGENIYFTATNDQGDLISYAGGPNFGGMMMEIYLTCATCHGPKAQGGYYILYMTELNAPDIRYETLVSDMAEEMKFRKYDLEAFKKAVVYGQHPDGDSLDEEMPRWKMNDEDLADLFAFLQSLE